MQLYILYVYTYTYMYIYIYPTKGRCESSGVRGEIECQLYAQHEIQVLTQMRTSKKNSWIGLPTKVTP